MVEDTHRHGALYASGRECPNVPDRYHRAAIYVDRVLKGGRPAELPVEPPTTPDLLSASRTLAMGCGTPG